MLQRPYVVPVSDWQLHSTNYPDKCGDDLPLNEVETFRDRKLSRKDTLNVNEPSEEEMSTRESVDAKIRVYASQNIGSFFNESQDQEINWILDFMIKR